MVSPSSPRAPAARARQTAHLECVADDADTRVRVDRREVLRLKQNVVLGIRPSLPLQALALEFLFHRLLTDQIDIPLRLILDRREDVGAEILRCR